MGLCRLRVAGRFAGIFLAGTGLVAAAQTPAVHGPVGVDAKDVTSSVGYVTNHQQMSESPNPPSLSGTAQAGPKTSAPSEQAWTVNDTTMAAVIYMIFVVGLVGLLLGGGFMIVHLAMFTQRPEDHVGRESPGDKAVLRDIGVLPPHPSMRTTPSDHKPAA